MVELAASQAWHMGPDCLHSVQHECFIELCARMLPACLVERLTRDLENLTDIPYREAPFLVGFVRKDFCSNAVSIFFFGASLAFSWSTSMVDSRTIIFSWA